MINNFLNRTVTNLESQDFQFYNLLKTDIQEGIVGARNFDPENVVIVTWKNMSFAGGIDNSLFIVRFLIFFLKNQI